jgi:predicted TIM-barrel fold metal-dependent hydrolase
MMKQIRAQKNRNPISRRNFFALGSAALGSALYGCASLEPANDSPGEYAAAEPIIDIHQHTNYAGRTDEQLIAHQRALGITHSILLPAGRYFGLEAGCGGNETVAPLARKFPRQFSFFANEVPYLDGADVEIKKYLRRGAIGIGEQKFQVDCDSAHLQRIADIAADFNVPVLMHFQHDRYNTGIQGFHKVLEKYPRVNFIGHAQTWWANIDKEHSQPALYPKTPVTPGGLTDKLLRDYPNIYGDTSAGSGLNAFTRDEAHMRDFLERHQDKLLYGSDCDDKIGSGPKCQGAQILAAIRRLAPSKAIERKILHGNAKKLLRLPDWA